MRSAQPTANRSVDARWSVRSSRGEGIGLNYFDDHNDSISLNLVSPGSNGPSPQINEPVVRAVADGSAARLRSSTRHIRRRCTIKPIIFTQFHIMWQKKPEQQD